MVLTKTCRKVRTALLNIKICDDSIFTAWKAGTTIKNTTAINNQINACPDHINNGKQVIKLCNIPQ